MAFESMAFESMAFWLNRCTLSLRCANANSISRRRKQKTRDLRHLTFQVSVIRYTKTSQHTSKSFAESHLDHANCLNVSKT